MSTVPTVPAQPLGAAPEAREDGASRGALRRLLLRPAAAISLAVLALLVISAIAAPLIAPSDPYELDPANAFASPSGGHLMGADELGRDTFSRILYGGRLTLLITAAATALAIVGGLVWGGIAALTSKLGDEIAMRAADAIMAIPFLLLALILVAAFGSSLAALILILGIIHIPWSARIARTAILSELHRDYVRAAQVFGMGKARLVTTELLPNVVPTLMVQATVVAASVILVEAALSFIGLGVKPPKASWGSLLLDGYGSLGSSTWGIVFPGLFIFAAIWSLNTLADHVESVLDPRDQHR